MDTDDDESLEDIVERYDKDTKKEKEEDDELVDVNPKISGKVYK